MPSGSGYTSAPSVSFTGTGGSGGTASTTISVTNAIVVYGGGGFDPANPPLLTVGDVGSGTGAAVSAIVNPGWIISAFPYPQPTYLGNPGDAGNQVGSTSSAQASPLNEIYNDSNDMLFYGFGLAGATGVGVGELVAQNITPGGGTSNPSPYTVPNATGGTSAAVVDNISTAAQASSIYFATLGPAIVSEVAPVKTVTSPGCFAIGTCTNTVTVTTQAPEYFTSGESITLASVSCPLNSTCYDGAWTNIQVTNSTTFTFIQSCSIICVGYTSTTDTGTATGLAPIGGYSAIKLTQLGLQ
jgi:hypothetical protein